MFFEDIINQEILIKCIEEVFEQYTVYDSNGNKCLRIVVGKSGS